MTKAPKQAPAPETPDHLEHYPTSGGSYVFNPAASALDPNLDDPAMLARASTPETPKPEEA